MLGVLYSPIYLPFSELCMFPYQKYIIVSIELFQLFVSYRIELFTCWLGSKPLSFYVSIIRAYDNSFLFRPPFIVQQNELDLLRIITMDTPTAHEIIDFFLLLNTCINRSNGSNTVLIGP